MNILDLLPPLAGRLPDELDYRLVGTAAAAVQGVGLPVADIDLLFRRRADVDRVAHELGEATCVDAPRWLAEAEQYFARFVIDTVTVELSTVEHDRPGLHECGGDGPWDHYVTVSTQGVQIPAVRLELRLATELRRGRDDRIVPLRHHLVMHGCDVALLGAAMRGAGVPPSVQEAEMARLDPGSRPGH